jgi:hypothetical protein
MDKLRKHSDFDCNTPSSGTFKINITENNNKYDNPIFSPMSSDFWAILYWEELKQKRP